MNVKKVLRQVRAKHVPVAAISLVPRGAAFGSDRYMIQQAVETVEAPSDTPTEVVEYPIVALVQEHLDALPEEADKTAAMAAICDVLAPIAGEPALQQDGVAEELAEMRSRYPGWDLWDAFCSAFSDATDDEGKRTAIAELAELLTKELMPTEAIAQETPAAEGSEVPAGTEDTPEVLTQEAIAVLVQEQVTAAVAAAVTPLQETLTQAQTELAEKTTALAESDQEVIRLKSLTTPQSRQPEGGPAAIAQQKPASVWAGTEVDRAINRFR